MCFDPSSLTTKTLKRKAGTGWRNLFTHIETHHANYQEIINSRSPFQLKIPAKATNIFYWVKLVVLKNHPFNYVDDKFVRECSSLVPITSKTLTKYIVLISKEIEIKMQAILPPKFGLIFDGWSCGSDHYVAVFACFAVENIQKIYLLAFQPIPDYEALFSGEAYRLDAQAHMEYIRSTLCLYNRTLEDLLFMVGDNCSTNKLLSRLCGCPFIGCASHRLNLAAKSFLAPYELLLKKIQGLMSKLSTPKQSAKLRRTTALQPIKRNLTRWSSTFEMVRRLITIIEFVDREDDELLENIPSRLELGNLNTLFTDMEIFEQVTKRIQSSDIDLLVVRKLFDKLILRFPATAEHLAPDALIVESNDFESGLCELLRGGGSLTDSQIEALLQFAKIGADHDNSFVNEALNITNYVDVKYIPPTSNYAERFFSQAKHVLSDLRKSMLPKTFESLMVLKYNLDLWDAQLVAAILNKQ